MFAALRQRYKSLSKVRRATLWITLCSFLQRGVSFITVPIFTRMLTTAEYGSVSVYQSWEAVAAYLVTLGVTYGGFNNAMIKFKDDREGYASSVVGLVLAMGALWAVLCLSLSDLISAFSGLPLALLVLLFVEVVSRGVYDIWVSRMRFDFDYRKTVAASLLLAVGAPVLGVMLVFVATDKVLARIAGFVLVELTLAVVVGIAMVRRGRTIYRGEYWKFTLLFNVPLLPHYLSQVVLSSSDRIMIGNMCSASDAGIYSIAYTTGMIMTLLTSSLNSTVMPWLYRKLDERSYDRIRKTGVVLLGGIAVVILGVDALAPDIVAVLAPAEYGEAMGLVPVISASVFFMFVYSYCSNIELFYEKTRMATVASILAALLNIVLNLVFIPMFGYVAAGYSTLACYVAMAFAHYVFAQRVTKSVAGEKALDGRGIWGIGFAFCLTSIAFSCLYGLPAVRYGLVVAIALFSIWKRRAIVSMVREGLA